MQLGRRRERGAIGDPTAQPSASPSTAPTAAPTTEPSVAATASASAELVLSLDDISVEGLATTLIDGGWFADRTDQMTDTGMPVILLSSAKSDVVMSIAHDGGDTIDRITLYDPNRFASDEAMFDLGLVSGVLLNETLATEFVTSFTDVVASTDPRESILESATYGPDVVTMRIGADADSPDDGFIYFERAR